jgi:tetratricopeptide (TPR) repeat protein
MAKEAAPRMFMIPAKEQFDAGQFSAAIMTLQEGLKHYPNFVSARVLLGEIYWTSGEVALARTELEQVIKAVPDNFAAHRKLTMIYRAAGELEQAIRSCRTVLEANPRDLEMLALLQQLQTASGAPEVKSKSRTTAMTAGSAHGAAPSLTGAVSRPGDVRSEPSGLSLQRAGTTASEARETAAAPEPVDARSETDPDTIDTETLAELYIIQGHHAKGLSVYRRLAAKDPGNPRYRDRIELLERRLSPEEDDVPMPMSSPKRLSEEIPIQNTRKNQVRRLEGWLQAIRNRRRL